MNKPRATTIAEANAQHLVLPAFKDWRRFAGLIDGYPIADELGLDYRTWYPAQEQHWNTTGQWTLDVLHLRLMLFFAFRSDYMGGYTYTEHDDMVDSLLYELSRQLHVPYAGKDNVGET